MICACFFCGEHQEVGSPPCLATCSKCGKDFRVLRNRSGINVELSKPAADAQKKKNEGKAGPL